MEEAGRGEESDTSVKYDGDYRTEERGGEKDCREE